MDTDSSRKTVTSSVLNSLDVNIQDDIINKLSSLSLCTPVKNVSTSSGSKKKNYEDQENQLPQNVEDFVFKKPLPKETMAKEDSNLDVIIDELNYLQLGGTPASEKRFNLGKWSTPLKSRQIDFKDEEYPSHADSSHSNDSATVVEEKCGESDDACSEYYECDGDENFGDAISDPLNTTGSSFESTREKNKDIPNDFNVNTTYVYTSEPVSEEKIAEMNKNQNPKDSFILEKFLEANTSQCIDGQDIRLEVSVSDATYIERTIIAGVNELLTDPSNGNGYENETQNPTQAEDFSYDSVETDSSEDANTVAATIGSSDNLLDDYIRRADHLSDQNIAESSSTNISFETNESGIPNSEESELKTSSQDISNLLKISSLAEQNVDEQINKSDANAFKFTFEPVSQPYSFPTTSFEMTHSDAYVPDMFCQLLQINTTLPKSPTKPEQYPSPIERFANAFTTESSDNIFLFPSQSNNKSKIESNETPPDQRANKIEADNSSEKVIDDTLNIDASSDEPVATTDSIESPNNFHQTVNKDLESKQDTSDEVDQKETELSDKNHPPPETENIDVPKPKEDSKEAEKSIEISNLQIAQMPHENMPNDNAKENLNVSVFTGTEREDNEDPFDETFDLQVNLTVEPAAFSVEPNETFRLEVTDITENEPNSQINLELNTLLNSSETEVHHNSKIRVEAKLAGGINEHDHSSDHHVPTDSVNSSSSNISSRDNSDVSIGANETLKLEITRVIDGNECNTDDQLNSETNISSHLDPSVGKEQLESSVESNETFRMEITSVIEHNEDTIDQTSSKSSSPSHGCISSQIENPQVPNETKANAEMELTRVIDGNENNVDGQSHSKIDSSFQLDTSLRKYQPNETFQMEITCVADHNERDNVRVLSRLNSPSLRNISPQKENSQVSTMSYENTELELTGVTDGNDSNTNGESHSEINSSSQLDTSMKKVPFEYSVEPNGTLQMEMTCVVDHNEDLTGSQAPSKSNTPAHTSISKQKDNFLVSTDSRNTELEQARVIDRNGSDTNGQSYSEINSSSQLDTSMKKVSVEYSVESNETLQMEMTRVIDHNEDDTVSQALLRSSTPPYTSTSQPKHNSLVSIECHNTELELTRVIDENESTTNSQSYSEINSSSQLYTLSKKDSLEYTIEPNETFQMEMTRVIEHNVHDDSLQALSASSSPSLRDISSQKENPTLSTECIGNTELELTRIINEHDTSNNHATSDSRNFSQLNITSRKLNLDTSVEPNETLQLETTHIIDRNERSFNNRSYSESNSQLNVTPQKPHLEVSIESNETHQLETTRVIDAIEHSSYHQSHCETNSPLNITSEKSNSEASIEPNETLQLETTRVIDENDHNLNNQSNSEVNSRLNITSQKPNLEASFEPNEAFQLESTRVIDETERSSNNQSDCGTNSQLNITFEKPTLEASIEPNETLQLETTRVIDENDRSLNNQSHSGVNSQLNITSGKPNLEAAFEPNETFQLETTRVIDETEYSSNNQSHSQLNNTFEKPIMEASIELNETLQLETTRVIDEIERSSNNRSDCGTNSQLNITFEKPTLEASIEPNETVQLETTRMIDETSYRSSNQSYCEPNAPQLNSSTKDILENSSELNRTFQQEATSVTDRLPSQTSNPCDTDSPQHNVISSEPNKSLSSIQVPYTNVGTDEYDDMAMEVDEEIAECENRKHEIVATAFNVFDTSAMSICDTSTNIAPQCLHDVSQPAEFSLFELIDNDTKSNLTINDATSANDDITSLNGSNMDETTPIDGADMISKTDESSSVAKYRMVSYLPAIPETNEEADRDAQKEDSLEECSRSGIDVGNQRSVISGDITSCECAHADVEYLKNHPEHRVDECNDNSGIEDMEIEPPSNINVEIETQSVDNEIKEIENVLESTFNFEQRRELEQNLNTTVTVDSDTIESNEITTMIPMSQNPTQSESKSNAILQQDAKEANVNDTADDRTIKSQLDSHEEADDYDSSSTIEASPSNSSDDSNSPSHIPLDRVSQTETPPTSKCNKNDSFVFKTPICPKLPSESSFNADYRAETPSVKVNEAFSPRPPLRKSRQLYSPFYSPIERTRGTPKASGDVPTSLLDMSLGYFEQFTAMTRSQNARNGESPNIGLDRTRDVDDEPVPEEPKLLLIEEPGRMVNAKTQTHDTELDDLRSENDALKAERDQLKIELAESNRKFNEVLELAKILHANETALKEACKQHEENTRILNNKYELLKEYSNELLVKSNAELDEAEAEINALREKLAKVMKKS